MTTRQVEIIVTNTVVGYYEARSYPDQQADAKGFYNLYKVPVYNVLVSGTNEKIQRTSSTFKAPRFMPYFNDPIKPNPHYQTKGWVNAGLSSYRKVVISQYKQDYRVQNRFSPGIGAIVVHGAFFIHAGPASFEDVGFGSAGCIEIIGDYNEFKNAIASMSGFLPAPADSAIQQLVQARKLIVTIQAATTPDIKKSATRKIQ